MIQLFPMHRQLDVEKAVDPEVVLAVDVEIGEKRVFVTKVSDLEQMWKSD